MPVTWFYSPEVWPESTRVIFTLHETRSGSKKKKRVSEPISGQDYEKWVQVRSERDLVVLSVPQMRENKLTGEAAIKLAHLLHEAGEKAADYGKIK